MKNIYEYVPEVGNLTHVVGQGAPGEVKRSETCAYVEACPRGYVTAKAKTASDAKDRPNASSSSTRAKVCVFPEYVYTHIPVHICSCASTCLHFLC